MKYFILLLTSIMTIGCSEPFDPFPTMPKEEYITNTQIGIVLYNEDQTFSFDLEDKTNDSLIYKVVVDGEITVTDDPDFYLTPIDTIWVYIADDCDYITLNRGTCMGSVYRYMFREVSDGAIISLIPSDEEITMNDSLFNIVID